MPDPTMKESSGLPAEFSLLCRRALAPNAERTPNGRARAIRWRLKSLRCQGGAAAAEHFKKAGVMGRTLEV